MPRRPEGEVALTSAQKMARWRAKQKAREAELITAIDRALLAHTISEARGILLPVIKKQRVI